MKKPFLFDPNLFIYICISKDKILNLLGVQIDNTLGKRYYKNKLKFQCLPQVICKKLRFIKWKHSSNAFCLPSRVL